MADSDYFPWGPKLWEPGPRAQALGDAIDRESMSDNPDPNRMADLFAQLEEALEENE